MFNLLNISAGDHVKFNFPMAWSTATLAWGLLEFTGGYQSTGEYNNMLDSLRWPLNYFIKCHVSPNNLYGQVRSSLLIAIVGYIDGQLLLPNKSSLCRGKIITNILTSITHQSNLIKTPMKRLRHHRNSGQVRSVLTISMKN